MTPLTTISVHDDIAAAAIEADIDLANVAQIHEELLRGATNASRGLIVDLTLVRYVDSAGVRSFFELARKLEISRQLMGIVIPAASPIRRLVKITKLDEVAVVGSNVQECLVTLREMTKPNA